MSQEIKDRFNEDSTVYEENQITETFRSNPRKIKGSRKDVVKHKKTQK